MKKELDTEKDGGPRAGRDWMDWFSVFRGKQRRGEKKETKERQYTIFLPSHLPVAEKERGRKWFSIR